MRTTITLDPDTDEAVRRLMRDRGLSFKQAVNEAEAHRIVSKCRQIHGMLDGIGYETGSSVAVAAL